MKRTCHVPGCSREAASRYSSYCRSHKARLRRHGEVGQEGITATDLKPYLARVRKRIEKNRDSPAWGQLDHRWLAVIDHARTIMAHFASGRPGPSYERRAAHEVIKLADTAKARDVVEVVAAMFLMQEMQPSQFHSDAAFRFQLVRRVRALGNVNAGERYDYKVDKVRRVYRELSPKAIAVMGKWLAEALGVAGLHLARLQQQEEQRERNERMELHKALEELK